MTTSMTMEKDQSHMNEEILELTLEIVYLLTGEDCKVVKKISGEPLTPNRSLHRTSPITMPPPHCLKTDVTTTKKILEVTKNIINLLTGEVPIRCQDVTVYFSMEEWEYLEGHKDLYKDVMMASQPALTSPDGSNNGNPPERCPRPLYSHRDSTQENLTISQHHQREERKHSKVEVKEEEEEILVSGDQLSMEEEEMIVEGKQEEPYLHIDTNGCYVWNTSERHFTFPTDCCEEDNDLTQNLPRLNPITQNVYCEFSHLERSMNPSSLKDSSDKSQTVTPDVHLRSLSVERTTDPFDSPRSLGYGIQTGENLSSLVCENIVIVRHDKSNTSERGFLCQECGKSFSKRGKLIIHQRSHTGERPFSCSECGKCFTEKGKVIRHQRTHTGERPFFCSECGKCFSEKAVLIRHQQIHTGERPFSCSECGKCFSRKGSLTGHYKIHTRRGLYSCPECERCFTFKKDLSRHQRIHTGERPYTCPECGKCFNQHSALLRHQSIHSGEDSFSCSECGKCFSTKSSLVGHQKTHTGTFSC